MPLPLRELIGYGGVFARFPGALHGFVRQPLTLERAHGLFTEQLGRREESFMGLVRESVYGHPGSPYLPLLELAGFGLADVDALVAARGLEGALRELREAGVYVSYEEFKGRRPIERHNHIFPVAARDFDNPRARRDVALSTGGSTGQSSLVYQDLDHIAALAVDEMVALDVHGVLAAPTIHWSDILPGSGIRFLLQRVHHGQLDQRWFTPTAWRDTHAWRKYAAATRYMLWWLRRFGVRVDGPAVVVPQEAVRVARAVRETIDREGSCLLYTSVSRAVRVATAAQEAGLDLGGATVRLASEPLTPSRRRMIEAVGARVIAGYGSIETGVIAVGCLDPEHADDVHVLDDAFVLFDHERRVGRTDAVVSAFNLTGLRSAAPKVMLNYEIDDHGVVEVRSCRCGLGKAGLGTHLHGIRSYTKLVGEGGTIVGEDLLGLIEGVLPDRYGGTPLDYQLREEEHEGLTRLVLVIDPSVEIDDEDEVVAFVLGRLRKTSPMADATGAVWERAGTLGIARRAPELTARGKFQSLVVGGG